MNSRRSPRLLGAILLLVIAACESPTAPTPSVQDGFDAPGTQSFGQPTLLLSNGVAVGRSLQPIVLTPSSGGYPDVLARHLSRFRSSNAAVIVVNFDGTLTAKGTGSAYVTVNLDGLYDSTRVTVISGWTATLVPVSDYLVPLAVNDKGDVVASGLGKTALVHNGTETMITDCTPAAVNNLGEVACNASTPGIWKNGVMTPLAPGAVGSTTGIDDSGDVYGTIVDYPSDGNPSYEYFIGKPGALQQVPLSSSAVTGSLNNHAFGMLQWDKGYVVSANGRIPVRGSDTSMFAWPVDINDRNDVVGSIGSFGGIAVWSGANMPTLSGGVSAPWIGKLITNAPCTPIRITNQGQIFGSSPDGPCLYDMEGRYTDPASMISLTAQPDWTIEPPSAESRGGILAALAQNRTNDQWAIALIEP
jgi:hypothetical protein